jgi:hypothetical protein
MRGRRCQPKHGGNRRYWCEGFYDMSFHLNRLCGLVLCNDGFVIARRNADFKQKRDDADGTNVLFGGLRRRKG